MNSHKSSIRRVAVITGTRSEFGLLEPVLKAIQRRSRLEPQLIVTGMHLLPRFGRTIDEIRRSGWKVDALVRMQTGKDDVWSEPAAAARGVDGIARALRRLKSDVAVVLGDRIEAFAGATAAALARVVVAHIHGGDRATGQTDDALRNAITRLAHVHLVASNDAKQRLLRMGEAGWRIHRVGAPGLDDIAPILLEARRRTRKGSALPTQLERRIAAFQKPYAVIIQHPVSSNTASESRAMRDVLSAVSACELAGVVIYPNNDPGHSGILRTIDEMKASGEWAIAASLPRADYLRIVSRAKVLVGNSSSGIIESASLGVNAVNIGPRQNGRLRCGPSVVDVPATPDAIRRGIHKAIKKSKPRPLGSVYGTGRASSQIAAILEKMRVDDRLLRKELTY